MNISRLFIPEEKICGLEINDSVLRAACFERRKNSLKVRSYSQLEIPKGIIKNGEIIDSKNFKNQLKKLFKKARPRRIKNKYFIISIPDQIVYTNIIYLPPMPRDKINLAIESSSDKAPYPYKESNYDWQESTTNNVLGNVEILFTQSKTSIIDKYIKVLTDLGITSLAFEPRSLSIARIVSTEPKNSSLIIEGNEEGLTLVVKDNYDLKLTHTLTWAEATHDLNRGRKKGQKKKSLTLKDVKNTFVEEAKKTINYYVSQYKHQINDYYIIGEAVKTPGLIKHIEKSLKISLKKGTAHFDVSKDILKQESFAVFGAAARGLIPRENDTIVSLHSIGTEEYFANRLAARFISTLGSVVIAVLVLIIVLFVSVYYFLIYEGNKYNIDLIQKSGMPANQEIDQLEQTATTFNQSLAKIKVVADKTENWADILTEINGLTKKGIVISDISMTKKDSLIELKGTAENRTDLLSFTKQLQEKDNFIDVDNPISNLEKKKSINFIITFKVKE